LERQQAEAERAAKARLDEKKMRQLQDEAKDKFVNPQVSRHPTVCDPYPLSR
jgi:hypothetical protein